MNFTNLLLSLLLSFPSTVFCQKLIWVHRPFSEKDVPNWRYSLDTVGFSANSEILGLVYLPDADKNNPQLELRLKNTNGKEKTANFALKSFDPSQLNWHSKIKQSYQFLLNNSHWYYLEITPNPSVINAYDGVDFLEVLHEMAKENKKALFSYQSTKDSSFVSCTINFNSTSNLYSPLWKKLSLYQEILANKKEVEDRQASLVQRCTPPGFEQVTQWANQSSGLKSDLKNSDMSVFEAVENLKIITEAIPDSISSYLKRELRGLLMLDIAILELPNGNEKASKIRQKLDLVKQLSLYPELQEILQMYASLNTTAVQVKQTEKEQEEAFKEISKLYQPFEAKYNAHVELQTKLEKINASLVKFD